MDNIISLREAAERLNLSTAALRYRCQGGWANALKIGRDWFVDRSIVEQEEKANNKNT